MFTCGQFTCDNAKTKYCNRSSSDLYERQDRAFGGSANSMQNSTEWDGFHPGRVHMKPRVLHWGTCKSMGVWKAVICVCFCAASRNPCAGCCGGRGWSPPGTAGAASGVAVPVPCVPSRLERVRLQQAESSRFSSCWKEGCHFLITFFFLFPPRKYQSYSKFVPQLCSLNCEYFFRESIESICL